MPSLQVVFSALSATLCCVTCVLLHAAHYLVQSVSHGGQDLSLLLSVQISNRCPGHTAGA